MNFDPTSVEVTCVTLPKDQCVQVPWKYIKVYVDTVTLVAKTWTKGNWPLDDLWPYICWGNMCDSTQGSLCPSPMGIHQHMWIQWSILQITTYILCTTYYILRTTYRMSDHTVSFWTQFRRDKNYLTSDPFPSTICPTQPQQCQTTLNSNYHFSGSDIAAISDRVILILES